MKKIKLFFVTLAIAGLMTFSSYAAMTIDWQNTTANIVVEDNMRCIAYNPVTNHLLLSISDGSERGIKIIDSNDGTILGSLLAGDSTWDAFATISIPYGIAVDANGVIYVVRGFYSGAGATPLEILRWADEVSLPTSVVTTDANMVRSLHVVGTGVGTKLVMSAQGDEKVRIYETTDGLNFSLFTSFATPADESAHDALSNTALDKIYTTRAFDAGVANSTHKWVKSGEDWSEDLTWTQTQWVMSLTLSESANTLYGTIWDMAQGGLMDGIRAWNATTGAETDLLDIGETGGSTRGCYIALQEGNVVDVAPDSVTLPPAQTRTLVPSANLTKKLYFVFCGGVGYGRVDVGAVVTGPVWSSNNYSVASVDGTGLVTSIAVGVCTVSATYTREAVPYTDSAVINVVATSAPLAPEATSYNRIHRVTPIGEISMPRVTRSWELFQ